jgi:hypothetical protein
MHRVIEDHLEEVLAESGGESMRPALAHLAECANCREEVSVMRQHASMLRALRAPQNIAEESPRPGFYARVLERIEAQRPIDIWQLFFDSSFARRIAMASMAMAVLFGVYLISSERLDASRSPVAISQAGLPDKDTVLVNLVTYREQ